MHKPIQFAWLTLFILASSFAAESAPKFEPAQIASDRYSVWQLATGEDALTVKRGEQIPLHFRITLSAGHHANPPTEQIDKYGPPPTQFTLAKNLAASLQPEIKLSPRPTVDEWASKIYNAKIVIVDRPTVFIVPLTISKDAPLGPTELEMTINSRAPNDIR